MADSAIYGMVCYDTETPCVLCGATDSPLARNGIMEWICAPPEGCDAPLDAIISAAYNRPIADSHRAEFADIIASVGQ